MARVTKSSTSRATNSGFCVERLTTLGDEIQEEGCEVKNPEILADGDGSMLPIVTEADATL
jgi:hypothetical protein